MSPFASFFIAALGLLAIWSNRNGCRGPMLASITFFALLLLLFFRFLPKVRLTFIEISVPTSTLLIPTTTPLLPLLYLIGASLFIVKLLLDLRAFSLWKKQSTRLAPHFNELHQLLLQACQELGYQGSIRIRIHPHLLSPVAVGLRRPAIYLPPSALQWSDEALHAALLHEVSHHARRDLWISLTTRLICILHWFNPLTWILRRQLLNQCEFACDARVLKTGFNPKTYAHTLCDLALSKKTKTPHLTMVMAMATTKASLQERVEYLLKPHRPPSYFIILATTLLTLGTAFALSVLRPAIEHSLFSPQEVQLRHSADPFPQK